MFSLFSVVSFRLPPRAFPLTWCALLLTFFFFVPSLLAQWEPDVRLTYNDLPSFTSLSSCVAAGPGAMVHVVWANFTRPALDEDIYYKRSTNNGVTWEAETRLTWDQQLHDWLPSVTISDSVVHVVWMYSTRDIVYRRSTDGGGTWEAALRISVTPNGVKCPSVAVSDSVVHVVWMHWAESAWPEIFYTRSTNSGASWSGETRLTTVPWDSLSYAYLAPSISVSGSVVHVVWGEDNREGSHEIYYKRSTNNGVTWQTDTRLTNDPAWSRKPSVSASGPVVHVAWSDERNGYEELYYKRSTDSGVTWGADTRLTTIPIADFPFVSASGTFVHMVWHDVRNSSDDLYYKRSTDSGVTWGADTFLSRPLVLYLDEGYPSVSAKGPFVHVVWTSQGPGGGEIYYKRNPTGNSSVEEETAEIRGHRLEVELKARPNPFLSFAAVPGHELEHFELYDIAGREVGIYKGDRIGDGLSPGVYFLKPEEQNTKSVRIVKVR